MPQVICSGGVAFHKCGSPRQLRNGESAHDQQRSTVDTFAVSQEVTARPSVQIDDGVLARHKGVPLENATAHFCQDVEPAIDTSELVAWIAPSAHPPPS